MSETYEKSGRWQKVWAYCASFIDACEQSPMDDVWLRISSLEQEIVAFKRQLESQTPAPRQRP